MLTKEIDAVQRLLNIDIISIDQLDLIFLIFKELRFKCLSCLIRFPRYIPMLVLVPIHVQLLGELDPMIQFLRRFQHRVVRIPFQLEQEYGRQSGKPALNVWLVKAVQRALQVEHIRLDVYETLAKLFIPRKVLNSGKVRSNQVGTSAR